MSEEVYPVPDGWTWTTLGEVCEPIVHVDPTKNPTKTFRYVDIASISNEKFSIVNPKEYTGKNAPSRARKAIKASDVLVSTVRTYLRNIAMVPPELHGEICSTGLCVLRPMREVADPGFVFRYVLTDFFVNRLTREQRGISYPAVTDRYVYAQPLPLAPLTEQRRIVSRVEEILQPNRIAKEALSKLPNLLKRFRQSVLAKAFRGELTERDPNDEPAERLLERIKQERRKKWEEKLRAKGKDTRKLRFIEHESSTSEPFDLPDRWQWTTIGSMFEVTVGGTPSRKKPSYWDGSIPWVTSSEVAFCRIRSTRERITAEGMQNSSAKIRPAGTVLLAMIGEGKTRGQAAILDIPATTNQNIASILSSETPMLSEYIYWWFYYRYNETRSAGEGGAQPALNAPRIMLIPIPLAPVHEQKIIVSKIEQLFAHADGLEKFVKAANDRAEVLERSVLTKAFRGELLPQDPADEPASVLLERIRGK
jgi:type I restriction enzyme S subunit